jgi:hypothetical protein
LKDYLHKNITKKEMKRRFRIRRHAKSHVVLGDKKAYDEIKEGETVKILFGGSDMSGCQVNTATLFKPKEKTDDPLIRSLRIIKEDKLNYLIKNKYLNPNKKKSFSSVMNVRLLLSNPKSIALEKKMETWKKKRCTGNINCIDEKEGDILTLSKENRYNDLIDFGDPYAKLDKYMPEDESWNSRKYMGLICPPNNRKDITTLSHNSKSRSKETTGAYDEMMSKYSMSLLLWALCKQGVYNDGMEFFYVRNMVASFSFKPKTLIDRIYEDRKENEIIEKRLMGCIKDLEQVQETFEYKRTKKKQKKDTNKNTTTKDKPIDLNNLRKKLGSVVVHRSTFPAAFYTPEYKIVEKACHMAYEMGKMKNDIYLNHSKTTWMNDKEHEIMEKLEHMCLTPKILDIRNNKREKNEKNISKYFMDTIREKTRILVNRPGSIIITGSKDKYVSSFLYNILHSVLSDIIEQSSIEEREKKISTIIKTLDSRQYLFSRITTKELQKQSTNKHDEKEDKSRSKLSLVSRPNKRKRFHNKNESIFEIVKKTDATQGKISNIMKEYNNKIGKDRKNGTLFFEVDKSGKRNEEGNISKIINFDERRKLSDPNRKVKISLDRYGTLIDTRNKKPERILKEKKVSSIEDLEKHAIQYKKNKRKNENYEKSGMKDIFDSISNVVKTKQWRQNMIQRELQDPRNLSEKLKRSKRNTVDYDVIKDYEGKDNDTPFKEEKRNITSGRLLTMRSVNKNNLPCGDLLSYNSGNKSNMLISTKDMGRSLMTRERDEHALFSDIIREMKNQNFDELIDLISEN